MTMPATFRCARWSGLVALLAVACGFLDPLDQPGLRVVMEPRDTAVYVGASFQAHAVMVNRYADRYPSDHLRYTGTANAIGVDGGGLVTGLAYGRAGIVATRGDLSDYGWVSVVPAGMLALRRAADPPMIDIVNLDGSGFRTLAAAQYGAAPAWLPGDAGLVHEDVIPATGTTAIYVTDLAGTSRLLATGMHPRPARDGSWVYYEYERMIWRVRIDGTGSEQLTPGGGYYYGDYYPDPSPDGTRLAYMSTRFAIGEYRLMVRELESGTERQVSIFGLWPRWDPTGTRIAYWSGDLNTGRGEIHIVGADGRNWLRASPAGRAYLSSGLDWSPDGEWLVARSDSTLDVIQVSTGLALPLGYASDHHLASWRW